jgi:hypothetical protein
MRRLTLFVAAVLLLSGCQIVTVLDGADVGEGFLDVRDVERLPGGEGFVAAACGFDGAWSGSGVIVAQDGDAPERLGHCTGPLDVAPGLDDDLYFTQNSGDPELPDSDQFAIGHLDLDTGNVTTVFTFNRLLTTVEVGPDGTVYFGAADLTPNGEGRRPLRIHEVTGPATSTPVPGTEDLGGSDFVVGADGTIVAAGGGLGAAAAAHRIFQVAGDGSRTLLAGTGTPGFSGDGGPATDAQLWFPGGVDRNALGEVFVADSANDRVRKIYPDGSIDTVAGGGTSTAEGVAATAAELDAPVDVAVDFGSQFWIAEANRGVVRLVGIQP